MRILRELTTCAGRRQSRLRRQLRQAGVDAAALGLRLAGDVSISIADSARLRVGSGVALADCRIEAGPDADLTLDDGAVIDGASLTVGRGSSLTVGRGVHVIRTAPYPATISVPDGSVAIGEEATIRGCMVVRFGGRVRIGRRTFVNQGAEIRCDAEVHIGDCTMVSYEVHIGDTNSHSLDWRARHEAIVSGPAHTLTDEPRPIARPVRIGDDCWIGKRATILKGVDVGDRAIVGAAAVVTTAVPPETAAVGNPATHRPIDLTEGEA